MRLLVCVNVWTRTKTAGVFGTYADYVCQDVPDVLLKFHGVLRIESVSSSQSDTFLKIPLTYKLFISIRVRGESLSLEFSSNSRGRLPEPADIHGVPAHIDGVPVPLSLGCAVTFLLAARGCSSGGISDVS